MTKTNQIQAPPWVDKPTLCSLICMSDTGVDNWVKVGILPPGRKRGHKMMWKWVEVEAYLDNGGPNSTPTEESEAERIRDATRKAIAAQGRQDYR